MLNMSLLNLNVVACSEVTVEVKQVQTSLLCVCHVGMKEIATKKIKTDRDVIWNDKFSLPIERGASHVVRVDLVQETNRGQQEIIGSTIVNLRSFDPFKWHDEWFALEGERESVCSVLRVQVRQACHLPAMDRNGKSDPYCILQVVDRDSSLEKGSMLAGLFSDRESQKTKIVSSCLDPVWNESFLFRVWRSVMSASPC